MSALYLLHSTQAITQFFPSGFTTFRSRHYVVNTKIFCTWFASTILTFIPIASINKPTTETRSLLRKFIISCQYNNFRNTEAPFSTSEYPSPLDGISSAHFSHVKALKSINGSKTRPLALCYYKMSKANPLPVQLS